MDTAEFKQQFLPYHRKLYRVAFRLTGNPQDAEDMVQEAYLKLWNKRDELADVLNTEPIVSPSSRICATTSCAGVSRMKTDALPKS